MWIVQVSIPLSGDKWERNEFPEVYGPFSSKSSAEDWIDSLPVNLTFPAETDFKAQLLIPSDFLN